MDGADWNIIDPLLARGELPNLGRLIERGSRCRLRSLQPMLSPVLWTTIATGVRPEKHGIIDFVAIAPGTGQPVPVTSTLRRAPAFWNLCSDAGLTVGVTAWWATYPAERVRGYIASDRISYQLFDVPPDPDPSGKTFPPEIFSEIRSLIVDPAAVDEDRLTGFLGAGAGPGETASAEQLNLERQLRALVASERTYSRIERQLAERFRPEVEVLYLQNTDTIAHLAMRFRQPAMPGIDPVLARRFEGAVDEAYREADRALGDMLTRAGESADVLVCSDHGFRSGSDRPVSTDSRIEKGRAAEWHRKYGILVLAGPHIRKGASIGEANLLDVAPTILALLGQPIPANFEGRALAEAITEEFLREHPIHPGPAAPAVPAGLPTRAETRPGENRALIDKLVSLGYLSQDSLNSRNNRGILLMNRGEFQQAIGEFQSALADRPDQPGILVNLARCHWLSGDAERARSVLERCLRQEPSAYEAENLLGNIEMATGRVVAAERHLHRALEIEPDYTDARNSLGILFETQSRWQQALAEYRHVVEVDPDYAEGYNNIGNVLRKMGRGADAEELYRRAIEADPTFAGSYNNLALLQQDRGDLAGAETNYQRALRIAPNEPRTHNNLGSLYFARGATERALAEFESAARLDPRYAEARNSLGVAYGKLGRRDEELEAYREALRLNPSYADAHFNLGRALLAGVVGRDAEEGRREMERALAADPRHLPALIELSGLSRDGGQLGRAMDLARRAVGLSPSSAAAHLALGQALAASGDRQGARREANFALAIDGSLGPARELLASLGLSR